MTIFKLGDIVWIKAISKFAHVHKVQGNDYYIVMDSKNTTRRNNYKVQLDSGKVVIVHASDLGLVED